jgi:hypothetical protein
MRRVRFVMPFVLGLLGVLQTAAPAAAAPPEKEPLSFVDSFTSPAGTLCDFTLVDSVDVEGFVITYVNAAGEPIQEFSHVVATVTHYEPRYRRESDRAAAGEQPERLRQ